MWMTDKEVKLAAQVEGLLQKYDPEKSVYVKILKNLGLVDEDICLTNGQTLAQYKAHHE